MKGVMHMRETEKCLQGVPTEIDELLHPARRYHRPADVVADAALTTSERRAILSSWASDACAVVSVPALRRAPFSPATVSFDEIMDAMRELDRVASPEILNRKPRTERRDRLGTKQSVSSLCINQSTS
jgi:hypothetical protein